MIFSPQSATNRAFSDPNAREDALLSSQGDPTPPQNPLALAKMQREVWDAVAASKDREARSSTAGGLSSIPTLLPPDLWSSFSATRTAHWTSPHRLGNAAAVPAFSPDELLRGAFALPSATVMCYICAAPKKASSPTFSIDVEAFSSSSPRELLPNSPLQSPPRNAKHQSLAHSHHSPGPSMRRANAATGGSSLTATDVAPLPEAFQRTTAGLNAALSECVAALQLSFRHSLPAAQLVGHRTSTSSRGSPEQLPTASPILQPSQHQRFESFGSASPPPSLHLNAEVLGGHPSLSPCLPGATVTVEVASCPLPPDISKTNSSIFSPVSSQLPASLMTNSVASPPSPPPHPPHQSHHTLPGFSGRSSVTGSSSPLGKGIGDTPRLVPTVPYAESPLSKPMLHVLIVDVDEPYVDEDWRQYYTGGMSASPFIRMIHEWEKNVEADYVACSRNGDTANSAEGFTGSSKDWYSTLILFYHRDLVKVQQETKAALEEEENTTASRTTLSNEKESNRRGTSPPPQKPAGRSGTGPNALIKATQDVQSYLHALQKHFPHLLRHQVGTYSPQSAEFLIVDGLKRVNCTRAAELKRQWTRYLSQKSSLRRSGGILEGLWPLKTLPVCTSQNATRGNGTSASGSPMPSKNSGTAPRSSIKVNPIRRSATSQLNDEKALAAGYLPSVSSKPLQSSPKAENPHQFPQRYRPPTHHWSLLHYWRLGYDLVLHYLQFGQVQDATDLLQVLFREYYNHSEDYVLVQSMEEAMSSTGNNPSAKGSKKNENTAPLLLQLGKTFGLLDPRLYLGKARHRPDCRGYSLALCPGSDVLLGVLLLLSSELVCTVLLQSVTTQSVVKREASRISSLVQCRMTSSSKDQSGVPPKELSPFYSECEDERESHHHMMLLKPEEALDKLEDYDKLEALLKVLQKRLQMLLSLFRESFEEEEEDLVSKKVAPDVVEKHKVMQHFFLVQMHCSCLRLLWPQFGFTISGPPSSLSEASRVEEAEQPSVLPTMSKSESEHAASLPSAPSVTAAQGSDGQDDRANSPLHTRVMFPAHVTFPERRKSFSEDPTGKQQFPVTILQRLQKYLHCTAVYSTRGQTQRGGHGAMAKLLLKDPPVKLHLHHIVQQAQLWNLAAETDVPIPLFQNESGYSTEASVSTAAGDAVCRLGMASSPADSSGSVFSALNSPLRAPWRWRRRSTTVFYDTMLSQLIGPASALAELLLQARHSIAYIQKALERLQKSSRLLDDQRQNNAAADASPKTLIFAMWDMGELSCSSCAKELWMQMTVMAAEAFEVAAQPQQAYAMYQRLALVAMYEDKAYGRQDGSDGGVCCGCVLNNSNASMRSDGPLLAFTIATRRLIPFIETHSGWWELKKYARATLVESVERFLQVSSMETAVASSNISPDPLFMHLFSSSCEAWRRESPAEVRAGATRSPSPAPLPSNSSIYSCSASSRTSSEEKMTEDCWDTFRLYRESVLLLIHSGACETKKFRRPRKCVWDVLDSPGSVLYRCLCRSAQQSYEMLSHMDERFARLVHRTASRVQPALTPEGTLRTPVVGSTGKPATAGPMSTFLQLLRKEHQEEEEQNDKDSVLRPKTNLTVEELESEQPCSAPLALVCHSLDVYVEKPRRRAHLSAVEDPAIAANKEVTPAEEMTQMAQLLYQGKNIPAPLSSRPHEVRKRVSCRRCTLSCPIRLVLEAQCVVSLFPENNQKTASEEGLNSTGHSSWIEITVELVSFDLPPPSRRRAPDPSSAFFSCLETGWSTPVRAANGTPSRQRTSAKSELSSSSSSTSSSVSTTISSSCSSDNVGEGSDVEDGNGFTLQGEEEGKGHTVEWGDEPLRDDVTQTSSFMEETEPQHVVVFHHEHHLKDGSSAGQVLHSVSTTSLAGVPCTSALWYDKVTRQLRIEFLYCPCHPGLYTLRFVRLSTTREGVKSNDQETHEPTAIALSDPSSHRLKTLKNVSECFEVSTTFVFHPSLPSPPSGSAASRAALRQYASMLPTSHPASTLEEHSLSLNYFQCSRWIFYIPPPPCMVNLFIPKQQLVAAPIREAKKIEKDVPLPSKSQRTQRGHPTFISYTAVSDEDCQENQAVEAVAHAPSSHYPHPTAPQFTLEIQLLSSADATSQDRASQKANPSPGRKVTRQAKSNSRRPHTSTRTDAEATLSPPPHTTAVTVGRLSCYCCFTRLSRSNRETSRPVTSTPKRAASRSPLSLSTNTSFAGSSTVEAVLRNLLAEGVGGAAGSRRSVTAGVPLQSPAAGEVVTAGNAMPADAMPSLDPVVLGSATASNTELEKRAVSGNALRREHGSSPTSQRIHDQEDAIVGVLSFRCRRRQFAMALQRFAVPSSAPIPGNGSAFSSGTPRGKASARGTVQYSVQHRDETGGIPQPTLSNTVLVNAPSGNAVGCGVTPSFTPLISAAVSGNGSPLSSADRSAVGNVVSGTNWSGAAQKQRLPPPQLRAVGAICTALPESPYSSCAASSSPKSSPWQDYGGVFYSMDSFALGMCDGGKRGHVTPHSLHRNTAVLPLQWTLTYLLPSLTPAILRSARHGGEPILLRGPLSSSAARRSAASGMTPLHSTAAQLPPHPALISSGTNSSPLYAISRDAGSTHQLLQNTSVASFSRASMSFHPLSKKRNEMENFVQSNNNLKLESTSGTAEREFLNVDESPIKGVVEAAGGSPQASSGAHRKLASILLPSALSVHHLHTREGHEGDGVLVRGESPAAICPATQDTGDLLPSGNSESPPLPVPPGAASSFSGAFYSARSPGIPSSPLAAGWIASGRCGREGNQQVKSPKCSPQSVRSRSTQERGGLRASIITEKEEDALCAGFHPPRRASFNLYSPLSARQHTVPLSSHRRLSGSDAADGASPFLLLYPLPWNSEQTPPATAGQARDEDCTSVVQYLLLAHPERDPSSEVQRRGSDSCYGEGDIACHGSIPSFTIIPFLRPKQPQPAQLLNPLPQPSTASVASTKELPVDDDAGSGLLIQPLDVVEHPHHTETLYLVKRQGQRSSCSPLSHSRFNSVQGGVEGGTTALSSTATPGIPGAASTAAEGILQRLRAQFPLDPFFLCGGLFPPSAPSSLSVPCSLSSSHLAGRHRRAGGRARWRQNQKNGAAAPLKTPGTTCSTDPSLLLSSQSKVFAALLRARGKVQFTRAVSPHFATTSKGPQSPDMLSVASSSPSSPQGRNDITDNMGSPTSTSGSSSHKLHIITASATLPFMVYHPPAIQILSVRIQCVPQQHRSLAHNLPLLYHKTLFVTVDLVNPGREDDGAVLWLRGVLPHVYDESKCTTPTASHSPLLGHGLHKPGRVGFFSQQEGGHDRYPMPEGGAFPCRPRGGQPSQLYGVRRIYGAVESMLKTPWKPQERRRLLFELVPKPVVEVEKPGPLPEQQQYQDPVGGMEENVLKETHCRRFSSGDDPTSPVSIVTPPSVGGVRVPSVPATATEAAALLPTLHFQHHYLQLQLFYTYWDASFTDEEEDKTKREFRQMQVLVPKNPAGALAGEGSHNDNPPAAHLPPPSSSATSSRSSSHSRSGSANQDPSSSTSSISVQHSEAALGEPCENEGKERRENLPKAAVDKDASLSASRLGSTEDQWVSYNETVLEELCRECNCLVTAPLPFQSLHGACFSLAYRCLCPTSSSRRIGGAIRSPQLSFVSGERTAFKHSSSTTAIRSVGHNEQRRQHQSFCPGGTGGEGAAAPTMTDRERDSPRLHSRCDSASSSEESGPSFAAEGGLHDPVMGLAPPALSAGEPMRLEVRLQPTRVFQRWCNAHLAQQKEATFLVQLLLTPPVETNPPQTGDPVSPPPEPLRTGSWDLVGSQQVRVTVSVATTEKEENGEGVLQRSAASTSADLAASFSVVFTLIPMLRSTHGMVEEKTSDGRQGGAAFASPVRLPYPAVEVFLLLPSENEEGESEGMRAVCGSPPSSKMNETAFKVGVEVATHPAYVLVS